MKDDVLAHLGAKPLDRPVDDYKRLLEDLESRVGRLPQTYARLLLAYQGAAIRFDKDIRYRPQKKSPWCRKSDGSQSLETLYGLGGESSLARQLKTYVNRIPHGVIPIGDVPGGNVICLAVQGRVAGKVYLWDHEDERPIAGVSKN